MTISSSRSLPRDPWGDQCSAWRLLARDDLAVAEEEMPPGTRERRHVHARARQLFYVLAGQLTLELDGAVHDLMPGDAIEVAPGLPHQASNRSMTPVRFLVISAPTTRNDRTDLD